MFKDKALIENHERFRNYQVQQLIRGLHPRQRIKACLIPAIIKHLIIITMNQRATQCCQVAHLSTGVDVEDVFILLVAGGAHWWPVDSEEHLEAEERDQHESRFQAAPGTVIV